MVSDRTFRGTVQGSTGWRDEKGWEGQGVIYFPAIFYPDTDFSRLNILTSFFGIFMKAVSSVTLSRSITCFVNVRRLNVCVCETNQPGVGISRC